MLVTVKEVVVALAVGVTVADVADDTGVEMFPVSLLAELLFPLPLAPPVPQAARLRRSNAPERKRLVNKRTWRDFCPDIQHPSRPI
jgi:hypothetical protein